MLGRKNWLVILVTKNSLQLIGLGRDVETISFPPSVINNMEVINKDELYTLITNWLKDRPFYSNSSIIWLLAPEICFEQALTANNQDEIDSETLKFLDTVPFEEVLSRMYKQQEWRQVIAVNKNLVLSLIQAFTLHGYDTRAVVPGKFVQANATLTPDIEKNSIKRVADLAKESFVETPPTEHTTSPSPKPKSSLPLLLGIFATLLIVLLVVIVVTR